MRHSHASMLFAAGVDIVEISKRLGHADPSITLKVYSHLFRSDDPKSAAAINATLARLRKPESKTITLVPTHRVWVPVGCQFRLSSQLAFR